MEIVVTGRHTEVKDRFRRHLEDKLAKVPQLAPRIQRLDVVISHETNRRQSPVCERVEITCVGKGPVVRAEAAAEDPYVALDLAYSKLLERLRRAHDRKVVHRGRHAPESVASATARSMVLDEPAEPAEIEPAPDEGPLQIRTKVHQATPMTLDQALYEMELVGHDFYLFVHTETSRPSVVYRRRGWEYGVLHLDLALTLTDTEVPASANGSAHQPAATRPTAATG